MKVCLYSHAFAPSIGGIETVSELLAEHLHRKGIEVTVVTQTALNGKEEASPYHIVRKPRLAALGRLVASHDLVHCNGMSVRGTLSAFRCGVPIVVTHQGHNAAVPRSVGEFQRMLVNEGARRVPHAVASALAMHLVDVNVCISRFVFDCLRPPRGLVLYNPVGRIFRPLPGADRTDRFAFVGRLVSDKGCDVLIRAVAACSGRGHPFDVDVYGDGPEREKLEALARECGVSAQVRFHGSRMGEDLIHAYHRSLAVIVPSLWEEPLGIVALEAMACGRAVIASAGGGLGEVVDGIGLTFPNGDFGALADCMMRLAENPALRQQSEQRGVFFARNLKVDVIGDSYLDLYRTVLMRRKRRGRNVLRLTRIGTDWRAHSRLGQGGEGFIASGDVRKRARRPRGIIVSHPGTQHSYETALALEEAGLLRWYLTGYYFKPENRLGRAIRLLPNGIGGSLEQELRRRFKPGLAPQRIKTFPTAELIYVASARLKPFRKYSAGILRWRNERFDGLVAQTVASERPTAVVCYDSCALRTFHQAKSLGIPCVLDQTTTHIRTGMKLFREEVELHPDFADSLPTQVPDWLIERCGQEALLADCILAPSDYVRQSLVANGVEPSRIVLVPYGAELERFQPCWKREDTIFRVLFVGQLSQRKGIKYLLEAFKQLCLPDVELVLVGGVVGSSKGLSRYRESFTHIGNVPHHEVHSYFQQADIFVYPSLDEGSALAIHEALASGLPVVTTPNSGSVVRDGIEGYIVPIRDVEALKEKMLLFYENKELREEMGRRARKRAEGFSWTAYRRRLGYLLSKLLEAKR